MSPPKRPIRRIACVGEAMIELVPSSGQSFQYGVAGDTFNTAIYLARQLRGTPVEVSFVTALGTDTFSERILAALSSYGIDAGLIERRADKVPGLYAIETDDAGERSFTYWRGESAARTLFSEPCTVAPEKLGVFDLIYVSGITIAILPEPIRDRFARWIAGFREAGGTFVYDSNYRASLWENAETARKWTMRMWGLADIALPSLDDEMALFGEADEAQVIQRIRDAGAARGVLKRGASGPLDLSGRTGPQGLKTVEKVADSTAAGDSFNAAYIAALAQGLGNEEAIRSGHDLATHVIRHKGAIAPDVEP